MSLLIKDVLLNGNMTSVYIEDNRITEIGKKHEADIVIDGKGKAILPGLVNTHTHAAMTLFRSYADDMMLQEWLETKIWPVEQKLTPDDVYWGTKLACLEMIKSGTTCFNDMYFHMDMAAKAVHEIGLRAVLSEGFVDFLDKDAGEEVLKHTKKVTERIARFQSQRIIPAWGPHAIYTVSSESLRVFKQLSDETGYMIHMHLSETRKEMEDCVTRFGQVPTKYLHGLGFLNDKCIFAHGVWLQTDEIKILAENRCKISHNPISNMKLAVGRTAPYIDMLAAGIQLSLGTDGAASNNSLDMFQTLKFTSLLQKFSLGNQTIASAKDVWDLATIGGAKTLGFDAGIVQEGQLADLILVDLKKAYMIPNHNLFSNLVYAANGDCVDTVICDGVVLMKNRKIKGEAQILKKASSVAMDVVKRVSNA